MKNALLFISIIVTAVYSNIAISQNNCTEEDLIWMDENQEILTAIGTDCGTSCLFDGDPDACMQACMGSQTPLTPGCITCFTEQVQCTTDNCLLECLFGSDADCAACAVANCSDPFLVCAGIYDNDGDGFFNPADCDDTNPDINPDAVEIWYDGVDQNCDGLSDFDQDGDGFESDAYGGTDCNDLDGTVRPDATEIWYDGVDQNCDGLSDYDQDMDGVDSFDYGGLDCDDMDPNVTNAPTWYGDTDMDGYGDPGNSTQACVQPPGMVDNFQDCDDSRNDVYPGAPGTGEGVDNDCNGVIEGDEEGPDCLADFNFDGIVNTTDLLEFLSEFGCTENCTVDLNGDGLINTSDLLIFLGQFGVVC